MVTGFCHGVNEVFTLLGCYVALIGMNDAQHPEERTCYEPLTDSKIKVCENSPLVHSKYPYN